MMIAFIRHHISFSPSLPLSSDVTGASMKIPPLLQLSNVKCHHSRVIENHFELLFSLAPLSWPIIKPLSWPIQKLMRWSIQKLMSCSIQKLMSCSIQKLMSWSIQKLAYFMILWKSPTRQSATICEVSWWLLECQQQIEPFDHHSVRQNKVTYPGWWWVWLSWY